MREWMWVSLSVFMGVFICGCLCVVVWVFMRGGVGGCECAESGCG